MIEICTFLFVLSIVYAFKHLAVFGLKFFEANPEPMTLTKVETLLLYLSIAYFITFLII